MARIIDITDRLSFDSNPCIRIKDHTFEVRSDAETMLKIMAVIKDSGGTEGALAAYELFFSEEDRRVIADMKLPFADFLTLIQSAMELVQGPGTGEAGTRTST